MNLQGEINYPCGFASLPGNDHCWLNKKCRVCGVIRTPEEVEKAIEMLYKKGISEL